MSFKSPLKICLILLLTFFISSCESRRDTPLVVDGVLDFSKSKIKPSWILDLKGSWEFYWKQVPINSDGEFDLSKLKNKEYITISNGSWQQNKNQAKGYGTFYLELVFPKDSIERILKIQRVESSAQVWINGKREGEFGRFSKSERKAVADGRPLYIDLGYSNKARLHILVSNYHHRKGGGFPFGASIASKSRVNQQKDLSYIIQSTTTVLILLIALYHFFIFLKSKNRLILFFALFTIFASLRQFFVGEAIIYNFFPDITFRMVQIWRYLPLYIGQSFFMLYFMRLLPNQTNRKIIYGIVIGYSLCLLFVLLVPTYTSTYVSTVHFFFTWFSLAYMLYAIIKGYIDKVKLYKSILLNTLIAIFFLTNDLLYLQKVMNSDLMLNFGLLCFLLLQTSINYGYWKENFLKIEGLSKEISELNEIIGEDKQEITFLLSESIQQLQSKQKLTSRLIRIKNRSENNEVEFNSIIAELKSKKLEESRLILIRQNIEHSNKGFLKELKKKHQNLTRAEVEICSLIRFGFSSDEICGLRSISKHTLKSARYRIRKKISLATSILLKDYLDGL